MASPRSSGPPACARIALVGALATAVAAATGCNALTLDGLQGGTGGAASSTGGGGDDVVTSSVTTTSSSTSGGGGPTTALASSSSGGAGGDGAGGSGGDGAGGSGGACPDVCGEAQAIFCDAFDGSDTLDAWFESVLDTEEPGFSIVDDPHVSCPHAARVDFQGANGGTDGGWAQLGRTIPGSPTTVRVDVRLLRQPSSGELEGVFEIKWDRGEGGCYFQVYLSEQPRAVSFYADQYGAVDAPLGGDSADLIETTTNRWMDVSMVVQVGAAAQGTVTVDGVTIDAVLDAAGGATCDEGIDLNSLEVRIGAPYNQRPTVLVYDDVVVMTD